ncbi:GNAT family N-acetyltransferase [Haloarcula pelagica]|uniref:GNAT family N-acetyltransferase n=1 Tax=Haloarcula pelagica TaxID=3033389 RepID=UPI0024C234CC|nr:GNAT family N-acetyltransferase [Halomicroarcula sp. YJ-61-S]
MQLWRLTRNRYGRAVYDALADRGVTATSMIEYVAELGDETQIPDEGRFTVERTPPERVDPLDAPTAELLADESVVAAFDGETPLGYLFCSVDATHEIHPLERRVQFDGAYVRRVYVDPSHRNRGVATRLVADALARASDRGAERATALVAVDNRPSRALFERHGFAPRQKRRYVRVGPFSHRSVADA